ncbi:MAG TPA: hypothetical protein VMC43_01940 [Candidatus Paceibacterota bacterium]|nr:hypothetical protein [Candidatus Paceibacterota bacterium]
MDHENFEVNLRPEAMPESETGAETVEITLEQAQRISQLLEAAREATERLIHNRAIAGTMTNNRKNLKLAEGWDEAQIRKTIGEIYQIVGPSEPEK